MNVEKAKPTPQKLDVFFGYRTSPLSYQHVAAQLQNESPDHAAKCQPYVDTARAASFLKHGHYDAAHRHDHIRKRRQQWTDLQVTADMRLKGNATYTPK